VIHESSGSWQIEFAQQETGISVVRVSVPSSKFRTLFTPRSRIPWKSKILVRIDPVLADKRGPGNPVITGF